MKRTESLPRIRVPQRRRGKNKKGGGGYSTEHARWRSPSDSVSDESNKNELMTQSCFVIDHPIDVLHRKQSELFVGDNSHGFPPTENEIKAESWPMDPNPPRMNRRPSVTFLPFAMRPLPLLQKKIPDSSKLFKIRTMRTTSRTKFRKQFGVVETNMQNCRDKSRRNVQHQVQSSAAGSYSNLWHDDKDSASALMERATQFGLMKMQNTQQRQRRSRVNVNKFPGGFKRKHDSNAYYYATSAVSGPKLGEIFF
jgi:hypothetical protein